MIKKLPSLISQIGKKFEKSGFEIYIVGGSVRDLLTGKTPKDWDFTTNAKPEEIQKIFPESFYDNRFGTVGIAGKKFGKDWEGQVFEITTFRKESG